MLSRLKSYLEQFTSKGVGLAFSGGVDSSLILAVLAQMREQNNFKLTALTMNSVLQSKVETSEAERLAAEYGVEHKIFKFNPLEIIQVKNNRIDRCYWCKHGIFSRFVEYASKHGLQYILDGTNADDLNIYRPGRKAIRELGIISPLAEMGINKKQIRQLADELNLSVATKPAAPCLATRFEYGTFLTAEKLQRIYEGEELVKSFLPELSNIRLRQHDNIARIEIPIDYIPEFAKFHQQITKALKSLGFDYVTLDLEGFRSGSMDVGI